MKLFINLTKNEIIKLLSQTSIRVLLIIWAVLIFLTSVGNVLSSVPFPVETDYQPSDDLEYLATGIYDECEELFFRAGYDESSWVYKAYFYSVYEKLENERFYYLISEKGYSFDEVNEYMYMLETDPTEGDSDEEAARWFKDCYERESEIAAEAKELITSGNIQVLIENRIDELNNEAKYYDHNIKQVTVTPYEIEANKVILNVINNTVEFYSAALAETNTENWKLNTIEYYYSLLSQNAYSTAPMSEKEYNSSYYSGYPFSDYSQYLLDVNEQVKLFEKQEKTLSYSIKNDLPVFEATSETSATYFWQTLISSNSFLLSIFLLVAAAVTMSNEYSTGTVRMLLIRPVKRWKIVLSKYTAIVFIGLVLTAVLFVATGIFSIIYCGAQTLYSDMYFNTNNEIYEVNAIISTLGVAFKNFYEGLFLATISFFFSVAVGKSVLAILLPFGVKLASSAIYALIINLVKGFGDGFAITVAERVLSFTFIPHFTYSQYFITANSMCTYYYEGSPFSSTLLATVILTLWTAAVVLLTLISFSKRDIKN